MPTNSDDSIAPASRPEKQPLEVPIIAHSTPPAGLTEGWEIVYKRLTNIVIRVQVFAELHKRYGDSPPIRSSLVQWHKYLDADREEVAKALRDIHGRCVRTWELGQVIYFKVNNILSSLSSAAGQHGIVHQPQNEPADKYLWTILGQLLDVFDVNKNLTAIAAAVVADSDEGNQPGPLSVYPQPSYFGADREPQGATQIHGEDEPTPLAYDPDPDEYRVGQWIIRPGEASFNDGLYFDVDGALRQLLIRLVEGNGRTVSNDRLKEACGNDAMENETLRTHVYKLNVILKRHFETNINPITSVGGGYRLRISPNPS